MLATPLERVARAAYRVVGAPNCAGVIAYPVDGPPEGLGIEVPASHDCFPGVPQSADSFHDHPGASYSSAENGIEVRYGRADGQLMLPRPCAPTNLQPSSFSPRATGVRVRAC